MSALSRELPLDYPREPARRVDPFVDQRLVILGPLLRQAFGVEPGAMHALGAEMMLWHEVRRILEAGDGQSILSLPSLNWKPSEVPHSRQ